MPHSLSFVCWFFSPTRMIVDRFKGTDAGHRAKVLSNFSKGFFWFEILWCAAILLLAPWLPIQINWLVAGLSLLYAYSRCNEIFYAFYNDALRQLDNESPKSELTRKDRVVMAVKSYVGLTLNFALIFYFAPVDGLFEKPLANLFEAIYFSGITVTTLGYGDIVPKHWVSRGLVLYEVFTGILLVVVAVGSYLGASDNNKKYPIVKNRSPENSIDSSGDT